MPQQGQEPAINTFKATSSERKEGLFTVSPDVGQRQGPEGSRASVRLLDPRE